jgi:RimJ/RimL family protein N-acetyltransferase
MKTVVYERVEEMVAWAKAHMDGNNFRDDATAIGVANDDEFVGVVVFDAFTTTGCWISVASDGNGRWLTREFIIKVFAYPFIQLGYPRLNAFVSVDNQASMALCEGFGFKREGVMRQAGAKGEDLVMLGMLKSECRWLPQTFAGKVPKSAI